MPFWDDGPWKTILTRKAGRDSLRPLRLISYRAAVDQIPRLQKANLISSLNRMRKFAPLSEKQLKLAQEDRETLKDLPVPSLETLRAQTPRRAIPNMTSKVATTGKRKLSPV